MHLKVKVLLPGEVMLHILGVAVVIVAVTVKLSEPAGMTQTG